MAPPAAADAAAIGAFADEVARATQTLLARAVAERRKPWSL